MNVNEIFGKVRHPFVYSFLSSWIISNWKTVYRLSCGITKPEETIAIILNENSFCSFWTYFHLFMLPGLGMIGYIYVGPRLLNWYLVYIFKQNIKKDFKESEATGNGPIPRSEYSIILSERNKLQSEKNIADAALYTYTHGGQDVDIRKVLRIRFPDMQLPPGVAEKMELKELITAYVNAFKNNAELNQEVTRLKARLSSAEINVNEKGDAGQGQ